MTEDQREDLKDLIVHQGMSVLLLELGRFVVAQEAAVLKYDLGASGDERQLTRLKCRAEGARKLATDFSTHISTLKAKLEKQS